MNLQMQQGIDRLATLADRLGPDPAERRINVLEGSIERSLQRMEQMRGMNMDTAAIEQRIARLQDQLNRQIDEMLAP